MRQSLFIIWQRNRMANKWLAIDHETKHHVDKPITLGGKQQQTAHHGEQAKLHGQRIGGTPMHVAQRHKSAQHDDGQPCEAP
jgi:hypothetical protein